MKFMSDYPELKGKVFESIKECKEAEHKVEEDRTAAEQREQDLSKLRKKLAKEISDKEELVKEAYTAYDADIERAKQILENSNSEVASIVRTAKERIKEAEAQKAEAIKEFNRQCGPYQKVYTGTAAEEEFTRLDKQFGFMLEDLLKLFF